MNSTAIGLGTFGLGLLSWISIATAQPNAAVAATPTAPAMDTAAGPAPVSATVKAPGPNVPATTPAATAAAAPGSCRLGNHGGIDASDAETAASLVCRELPRDAETPNYAYRVDLDKLGTRVFITLNAESNGQVVDSRRLELERIEEVPKVAPRLADALLHHKSMQETEQVGNLSWAEAEVPAQRRGRMLTSLGILGTVTPGVSTISPGLLGSIIYDTPHWVLTANGQLSFGAGNGDHLTLVSASVGPRYMLNPGNISLFIGAGMAIEAIEKSTKSYNFYGYSERSQDNNSGIAPYAEVGFEAMRLHRNRLNVALRAELPLFKVGGDYLVPITLSTSFIFDGF